jgi:site-specific recombinase XerD
MDHSQLQVVTLKHLLINNRKQIGLQFYPNRIIQLVIKDLPNVKWSKAFNMAYIENTKQNLDIILKSFKGVAWINSNHFFYAKTNSNTNKSISLDKFRKRQLPDNYRVCPDNYLRALELKQYALNTSKSYIMLFEKFINDFRDTELFCIDEEQIRNYLQKLIINDNKSTPYINLMINCIKFYYETVLNMPNRFYSIERPVKKDKLPKVISLEEVSSIISHTNNIKHKCIISLLYSAGLRRSELINLKLDDIDSKRMVIHVINAKGGKDRLTILSKSVLDNLRLYFKVWRPKTYLFEGLKGKQYSGSSISRILHRSCALAKIKRKVTPHILRHSFATHLLENGTDIRYIQTLLGHGSTKTTEIYTRVAINSIKAIKSPIELLDLK